MDFFQDALQAEISKKRKNIEAVGGGSKKKYVSRAELERQREEAYHERHKALQEKQLLKQQEKQKELEEAQEKRAASKSQQSAKEQKGDQADDEIFNISREEVIKRLRAKGQPIRLFAESDRECKLRLRTIELQEERGEEGGQNEYMRKLEEMEAGMRLDILKKGKGDGDTKKQPKRTNAVVEPIETHLIRSNREKLCMQIFVYLTHTMEEWDDAMEAKSQEEKQSGPGKRAAVLQKQTMEHLKPLLRQLKKMTMEPDVLARVAEITHFMQIRQYRDAQDSYLQLSIGNAPWPIGVTMVGIHERSAREKIFSSQVAHVLNDETSRKWIQGVKRLMTFLQTKYPPDTLSQLS
ncbi:Prp18-domain-containing protein [Hesseltinella vesiculosa]|uniref:Pre-mRNA-splicing factor 18 n=1 Tax=Hesseltinella vesiculosa TaxID=101127 RepID=A0A1X2GD40_9FUNG|nr:Prp18-domain-containing protein [Hesseltinella vesiculosa]